MSTKTSGKRLNLTHSRDGACYSRVKKSLKKTVTRTTRRQLNRAMRADG